MRTGQSKGRVFIVMAEPGGQPLEIGDSQVQKENEQNSKQIDKTVNRVRNGQGRVEEIRNCAAELHQGMEIVAELMMRSI